MFKKPTLPRLLADTVMDTRVVQHDYSGHIGGARKHAVDEVLDIRGLDSPAMRGVDQRVLAEIQRADDAATAMMIRLDLVGQTSW